MKPVAICVLVAFSMTSVAATARTVTNTPRNSNEQSVNGVAGPPPPKKVATVDDKSSVHKKALKKTKIAPPPPLHDPN